MYISIIYIYIYIYIYVRAEGFRVRGGFRIRGVGLRGTRIKGLCRAGEAKVPCFFFMTGGDQSSLDPQIRDLKGTRA